MNKRTISQLVRPSIAILKPYSSARDEFKGEASVFLDANESPYNSPFNRYPDPYQRKLKERISEIKGVGHTNIFLGNGSDEPIDLLIRAFCEPAHDNIITLSPTYGMYQVAASVNNVEVKEVWLDDDFSTSHKKLLAESTPNSKLMFLCSPNNPTGNSIERDELVRTIEGFDGIVVVDEAYIDFASQASLLKEIEKHPNLVILQTFSKGWAMAGIRLGMAFASEEIISILNKIKYPYNINILAQEKALELLNTIDTQQWITTTIKERERVKNEMQKMDCITKVFASDANFLLAKTTDAATMYTFLAQHGIVARNRSGVRGCLNCIRFTIGSPGENDTLLEVLKEYETNHQKK